MPTMHEEMFASSDLYESFPRYRMSDYTTRYSNGSIPNTDIPKSKYSSTETEFSSDDNGGSECGGNGGDISRHTASGFSTSTSSSSHLKKHRRRRKKRRTISCSGNAGGVHGLSSSLLSVESNSSRMTYRSSSSLGDGDMKRHYSAIVPALTSVSDLNHAIGRHRGISGSFTPAIDSALFAMFFATDVFDGVLKDDRILHLSKHQGESSFQMRKDATSVLRKEIVYSLRTSYFCPASKIVKLAQLVEENFPLEQFHDPAGFLDLLFSKILNVNHPPFLTYSNGSTGYIHRLPLEEQSYLRMRYSHPSVLTIQQLLQSNFGKLNSPTRHKGEGRPQFVTVPYPALILQVTRKSPCDDGNHLPSWTAQPNLPIIPNMQLDLTTLISTRGGSTSNLYRRNNSRSRMSGNFTSFYSASSENYNEAYGANSGGVPGAESRVVKGFKSAWKSMYKYLEQISSSSSDFSALSHYENTLALMNDHNDNFATTKSSSFHGDNDHYYINHLSSSSPSPSQSFFQRNHNCRTELEGSLNSSGASQPQHQVKMELIAVICYSEGGGGRGVIKEKNNKNGGVRVLPTYFVYCKAGNDSEEANKDGNGYRSTEDYAPWVMYQSRYGVAPQVTLIENFGKWISSLEKNYDEFSIYEVPVEIRRVLESSHLLIYKRAT